MVQPIAELRMSTKSQEKPPRRDLAAILWALTFLGAFGYLLLSLSQMPERVAIRFDFDGRPVASWERGQAELFTLGFLVVINAILVPLGTNLIRKVPLSILSIPFKRHWNRSEKTREAAYPRINVLMLATASMFNLVNIPCRGWVLHKNGVASIFSFSTHAFLVVLATAVFGFFVWAYAFMRPHK